MTKLKFVIGIALLALQACSPAPRPAGLPPPEYEEPKLEPWTPPSALPASSAEPVVPEPAGPPAPPVAPENVGGSGATLPPGPL